MDRETFIRAICQRVLLARSEIPDETFYQVVDKENLDTMVNDLVYEKECQTEQSGTLNAFKIDNAITAIMLYLHPDNYSFWEIIAILTSLLGFVIHSDNENRREYNAAISGEVLRRGDQSFRQYAEKAERMRVEQGRSSQ
jgi:hypothetical protein